MPYIADGTKWNTEESEMLSQVRAGQFFSPIAGAIPSGIVTVGAISATAQTFTNLATYLWNSGAFNTQGQRWEAVSGTATDGCRNAATPRTSGGVRYNHITSFEYLYTGQALDVMVIGSAYFEILVYVEHEKKMYRAALVTGGGTGLLHLPLNFPSHFHGRIRVVIAGTLFVGVKCEQSAILKPSPERITAILDGAEWAEGAGIKQVSGTSYLSGSLSTYLFERTGWVWFDRAQPDTGYFRNGSITVTSDTATGTNQTRFFSQDRKDWLSPDYAEKPIVHLITGSRDDGSGASGATGVSNGPMATRAKACYDWIRSKDRLTKIVQMSVSPNGSGTNHNLNLQEQGFATSSVKKAETIDASSWFNSTQRTALIGADGVNPGDELFRFWANKIGDSIANMLVSSLRARRLR